jgi:transposase-like protein
MTTREFLSTAELAARWGVSAQTLRNWRAAGQGPPFFQPTGPGGKTLYKLLDVEAWEQVNTRSVVGARETTGAGE